MNLITHNILSIHYVYAVYAMQCTYNFIGIFYWFLYLLLYASKHNLSGRWKPAILNYYIFLLSAIPMYWNVIIFMFHLWYSFRWLYTEIKTNINGEFHWHENFYLNLNITTNSISIYKIVTFQYNLTNLTAHTI